MQVFNPQFIQAINDKLATLQDGFYLTREQLCLSVGVDKKYANTISTMMETGQLPGYEAVKSRGIRRVRVAA